MKRIAGRVFQATEVDFKLAVAELNELAEDGYHVIGAFALGAKSFGVLLERAPATPPKPASASFFED